MIYESHNALERLLRDCELGWMIDWYDPPDQALPHLREVLAEATAEYRRRLGEGAPRFDEETLAGEYDQNPHKLRAFLQALGSTRSAPMLVLVWRIMQGATIQAVELTYEAKVSFRLRIVLTSSYDGRQDVYESTDINDAALLRHLGITTVEGKPLFDGFYPLRIR